MCLRDLLSHRLSLFESLEWPLSGDVPFMV